MSPLSQLKPPRPPAIPDFIRDGLAGSSKNKAGSGGFTLQLDQAGRSESRDAIGGLSGIVSDQVKGVNAMQNNAESMVNSLLTGGDVNEAEVLTSVQKADLAFRMLMQIRNKLMDAYREVQQIQI